MKTLDDNAWQYFSNHLLNDYDFIEQYADDMGVGSDGIVNALLVFNEKTGEGILVNSSGYAYARYSAYLPYAKQTLEYVVKSSLRSLRFWSFCDSIAS